MTKACRSGSQASCCFGGATYNVMHITTASADANQADISAEPEAGGIFAANVDTKGIAASIFLED